MINRNKFSLINIGLIGSVFCVGIAFLTNTKAFGFSMDLAAPEIASMVPLFSRADVPLKRNAGSCTLAKASISVNEDRSQGVIQYDSVSFALSELELSRMDDLLQRAEFEADIESVDAFEVERRQCGLGHTYWSINY